MPLFKSLKYITCGGIEYVPGQVVPDAESFPNLREMIDYRFLGYATDKEIEEYHAKETSKKPTKEVTEKTAEEKHAVEVVGKKDNPKK